MSDIKKSTLFLIFLYTFVFFGLISIYLGKDNNYDLRSYHYYQVYAFLNDRFGFDYLPCQIGTFLNPAINFLSYFLINYTHPMLAGFILGGVHGLNFWLVFVLSLIVFQHAFPDHRTMVKLVFSLISASVGAYGPGFFPEVGTTINDNLISIFALTALLLVIRWRTSEAPASGVWKICYLLLSALCMGMGIGFKLTASIYAAGMFFGIFLLATSWKDKMVASCLWGAGVLAGILASGGYWMMKLWYIFKTYKAVMISTIAAFACIALTAQIPDWGRLSWGSKFFEIETPEIASPENAIVLVTQPKPWSYLFSHFPPSIRFLRINTSLTRLGDDNKFQSEMKKLIVNHDGPVYLLSNTIIYEWQDQDIIAQYGLRFSSDEMLPIKSRHEQPGLHLCKLQKIGAGEPD